MDKNEKDKLIKREMQKLNKLFKVLPKDKLQILEGLKQQAAFMCATLQELQEIINGEGAIELFENGSQKMLREHPAAKVYNSLVKNYAGVIKQLLDLLPKTESKQAEDELLAFIKPKK